MKRILLYTVCGLAMLTMFNSCHIYNKYHRPDVDVEGLFRDTVAAGDTLAADSLNIGNLPVGRSLYRHDIAESHTHWIRKK